LGKRYTREEISQIQELSEQGLTDESIAQQLGRSTNAIRNIRYRNQLKSKIIRSIQELKQENQKLKRTNLYLKAREQDLAKAVQIDEKTLHLKIETSLTQLKHKKPELFYISGQEQINKLTAQIATSFIQWLIND
jgi:hypothetical protein